MPAAPGRIIVWSWREKGHDELERLRVALRPGSGRPPRAGAIRPQPEIATATLADYFANSPAEDLPSLCKAMIGDIRSALDDGLIHHATEVVMALRQFLEQHPHAAPNISIH